MNKDIKITNVMNQFRCEGFIDEEIVVVIIGSIPSSRSLIIDTLMVREDIANEVFVLECLCRLLRHLINLPEISVDPVVKFKTGTYDWMNGEERSYPEYLYASNIFNKCNYYFSFDINYVPSYKEENDMTFQMSLPQRRYSSPARLQQKSPPFIRRPDIQSPQRRKSSSSSSSASTVREIISPEESQFKLSL